MQRFRPAVGLLQHVTKPRSRWTRTRLVHTCAAFHEPEYHSLDRTNPTHILRHLLRECTYLPDPLSRIYIRAYTLRRFRPYQPSDAKSPFDTITHKRINAKLREARRAIIYLRKANHGFTKNLKKVLDLTYGRTGRRGRELLEPLKHQSPRSGHAGSEPDRIDVIGRVLAKRPTQLPSVVVDQLPRLSMAMEKLYLEQQRRARFLDSAFSVGKVVGPDIPFENSWKRPMPIKRVKNQVKHWYAHVLGKILPPLPDAVWNSLQQMVMSNSSHPAQSRRSARRTMVAYTRDDKDVSNLEMELGLTFRPKLIHDSGRKRAHRITDRYMRRRWKEVLEASPKLNWVQKAQSSQQVEVEWSARKRFARVTNLTSSVRAALQTEN